MEVPSGQSLYSYCANISMEDVHSLVLMRGITGMICFGLCLLSLVLEIFSKVCFQKGSTILQRFFVYVIVANLLRAAFLSMDIFSHRNTSQSINEKFCEAIGFLSQYFAAFQLLTIVTMMLVLLHNLLSLNLRYKHLCLKVFNKVAYADVFIVTVLFLLPSLYTWIPFVVESGVYGDSGPWCWLKAFDSNCSDVGAAFILETVLWNIPFGIVLMFCFVCVTLYLTFFLYVGCCRTVSHKRVTSILVDTCILFVFFTFYTSLCVIEISALMFLHMHKAANSTSYPLLVMYAITLPVGEISLSLTSFVHFFRMSCKSWKFFRNAKARGIPFRGVTSKLGNDSNVKPSTRISVKSYTSQQERPDFLSPSTECASLITNSETKIKYGTLIS